MYKNLFFLTIFFKELIDLHLLLQDIVIITISIYKNLSLMRHIATFLFFISASSLLGQFVSLMLSGAGATDKVTIIFDASQGNRELLGASKVYMHHGAVTDSPNGTSWKYVKGNWGKDDGVGEMTKVPGQTNKWQYTFSPNVREYFGVPTNENIFRISCVFRNADGSKKGTIIPGDYGWGTVISNNDIYVNLSTTGYITIQSPLGQESIINQGEFVNFTIEASSPVTEMKLWIDEGTGYNNVASITGGKILSYDYKSDISLVIKIKVNAIINGQSLETIKDHSIVVKKNIPVLEIPAGMKKGTNYIAGDPTKAILVLLAPEKEFVYVVGDMNDWKVKEEFIMNKTPDGKNYWIQINGLTPGKPYAFQYWIDGSIKIADPYADQVADPWNDKYINTLVYPNLPAYSREDLGIASVLTTGQKPHNWASSESVWQRPDVNHLVIYELHIRDFLASHSFKDLADTLSYLKRLGINAIELMPVNEFEGNDSWGYNPSFFFAVDKYYGPKEQLKRMIEIAHQHGIAVITDLVLNHAFGQCPLVQMYYDKSTNKPASNNPWFNREYVGQYQWGYDFNHESSYTKEFIDEVNRYWVEEFHFDGFRFDFTKGFTNSAPGGSIDDFDASRIAILKRMADKIWQFNPKSYIILEHWSPQSEESILGDYGLKMWRNKSYDFVPATVGNPTGTFGNMDATTHVAFYNSHDERRIGEHCLSEGRSAGSYNIKDTLIMFERVKMAAAFAYLQPGLKMIWQFDELGYDIDINLNGRTGRKPLVWGENSLNYYHSSSRQNIYKTYQGILHIRNTISPDKLASASKNHLLSGETRRLSFNTTDIDLVVIGNFGLTENSISPEFTQTGKWYNYFSGDSVNITSTFAPLNLKPGEWQIYTTKRLSGGQPGVVGVFDNPVTITPYPFKETDQIKIRFDASKATSGNTSGLMGSDKVYMHAGTVPGNSTGKDLTNIIGNLKDDGVGQMTKVGDNIWEITIVPKIYFNVDQGKEISQIGMWFRNGDNSKKGFGFGNTHIFFDVLSDVPIVYISPSGFNADTEITIIFNAKQGNRELVGAEKVYIHSGVGTIITTSPQGSAWNKVVGNWGKDDGVGLMTKIDGESDKWQIKMKPKNYYGMTNSEYPYWIAAVFRDAMGNKKGTATPGQIENGFIASNQDYFIKNVGTVRVEDLDSPNYVLYPNPASGVINFIGIDGRFTFRIINSEGREVWSQQLNGDDSADIRMLPSGLYYFTIMEKQKFKAGKLLIK